MRIGIGILVLGAFLLLNGVRVQASIIADLRDADGYGTVIYSSDTFTLSTSGFSQNEKSTTTGDVTVWEFKPQDSSRSNDDDFWDLDHGYYYTWYIPWSIPEFEEILSVELLFDNIRNWDKELHDLWIHLLDQMTGAYASFPGDADRFYDKNTSSTVQEDEFLNPAVNAAFDNNILIVHYDETTAGFPEDPDPKRDISYTFTASQMNTLASYLADSKFGIGLDADCHYYNDGIHLKITTGPAPPGGGNPVPEPGSVFLLGLGLISLAGCQRRLQS